MQVLERPSVVEPVIHLSIPVSPNNSLNRTRVKPASWDLSVAELYVHKSIDTTGWNYANNFRNLNMYERWTYTCQCCEGPVSQCINNETLHFGATQWQEYLKNMSNATLEQPAVNTANPVAEKAPRRRKGSFAQTVSSEVSASVVASYATGATIADVSIEFSIAATVVRDFLAAEGVLRGRGQGINRSATRARKTSLITPEILAQAMISFPTIGVVATAKNLNVGPVELSAAIKAAGGTVQRGRKLGSKKVKA